MRRRITGLELSGRFDVAARDWSPEDPDATVDPPNVISGGAAASVVLTRDGRRIAGPQATVAPHGRGQGWSEIGAASRRRSLAGAVDGRARTDQDAGDLRAAVEALGRGAVEVILAVPDLPEFGEAAQGAVLRAAAGPRRRARLLWRPVAAFLDLLGSGAIPRGAVGLRYRLLVHGPNGLEDQTLTLRTDRDHPEHRAPQRDGPGCLRLPELGLDALFARAADKVRLGNPQVAWDRCEASRLGPRLVTGGSGPGESEVLRMNNATWVEIRAPEIDETDLRFDRPLTLPVADVAATYLVTPLATPLADALCRRLAPVIGPVARAHPEIIARGALRAGRLIERGLPHYFDRLEPISIAVLRADEPDFEDLIPPNEVVPANREYVSPPLGGFRWVRGKTDTEFYVLKGGSEVRHWEVVQELAPPEDMPVTLRLRQTPGQSWARLSVTAPRWEPLERNPIDLDWEALTPQDLGPEDVLAKLRTPPPTIPDLLFEQPHLDMWLGGPWAGDGAIATLANYPRGAGASVWARLLSQSRRDPITRERFWLVGTEGNLPEGLPKSAGEALDAALTAFATVVLAATPDRPLASNDHLRALTWCFRRCPEPVQERLAAAIEARRAERRDPFLAPAAASTVVIQGAGRAVTGGARIHRILAVLSKQPLNNNSINALAMIFTRKVEATDALTRELVDLFLNKLGAQLHSQVEAHTFQIKFRNTLSAIAGLFRWRIREPRSLLAKDDTVARALRATLIDASLLLEGRAYRQVPQVRQKIEQIGKIIEYLDGKGDPDILRFIEADDEE